MAPELIGTDNYGKAVDWWACGALLYEMLTSRPPFYSEDKRETQMRICSPQQVSLPRDRFGQDEAELLSGQRGLLDKDPSQRLIGHDVQHARWFAQIDWDKLLARGYRAPVTPPIDHELDLQNFERGASFY